MQEITPVFNKIKFLLEENKVDYQLLEHGPVFTSEEAARIRGTKMEEGAKAIVFAADKKPILIVVPGDKKVDIKTFKENYRIRDLRLLKPEEVKELTVLEIGAIPPFGNVMGLPTYADFGITEKDRIVFNAGSHTRSVKMKAKDFIRLSNPIIGNFAK